VAAQEVAAVSVLFAVALLPVLRCCLPLVLLRWPHQEAEAVVAGVWAHLLLVLLLVVH
jgi:hypothetical protein